jgi:small subunit ribosomal protein S9
LAQLEGQYFYGVGRRKTASAQVRLYPKGGGEIVVNGRSAEDYFTREPDMLAVRAPLDVTGWGQTCSVSVVVRGGGPGGQAGAVQHGIARALVVANPELRNVLRQHGHLTRDPREKERKKPGLKRARKAPQYTKR